MTQRQLAMRPTTMSPGWKPEHIYAIRYATRPTALRHEHFYGHIDCGDSSMPIDYFVWLVTGQDEAIMIDAGYTPEVAKRRGSRHHLGSPLEAAELLGYPAAAIPSLVITHAHYDHTGYLHSLPNARIYLQERELAFWTGRYAHWQMYRSIIEQQDVLEIVRRNFEDSIDLLDGDTEIAPGVSVHLVGGHTAGMQVVRVEIEGQSPTVLASDATHFFENIATNKPFSITHSTPGMFDAFERVRALAGTEFPGQVVPGHDPQVKERYPEVGAEMGLDGRVWQIA